ncbi:DNA-binding transcriptional MerR regulator [Nocardia transvalensis]|uniref:DNA-binding transcriptional MerR regulator n=1 Tax=Nocardia transvalensis TaxID=37333 RepID=A0A7W9UMK7_9NOCA|nr:MerR family transcriptional regulator [Nocardia transvalensis]MBB5918736.1 DNA-binding transcriptional MerR regulator [Nocardia transvalensis]
MTAGTEYTIDELAHAAGTTVRSLRVYHERGVLPPPRVKGRTGFYGEEHLNRVRVIGRLLNRGIKLNGIKELINAWDRGDDLGDILGVGTGEELAAATPSADTLTAAELAQRYRDVPQGLSRVVGLGLYEPVDAVTYSVADRTLLDIAEQFAAAGMPDDAILEELERLRADCDRIARRFVDLFERTTWNDFRRSERGPTDLARLVTGLTATRTGPERAARELIGRSVAHYLDQDTELAEVLPGT